MRQPLRVSVTPFLLTALVALVHAAAASDPRLPSIDVDGSADSLLQRPARLDVESATLVAALEELHRRSGVNLFFSPSQTPDAIVTCPCQDATVEEALTQILKGTDLRYRQVDTDVVIVPTRAAPRPQSSVAQIANIGNNAIVTQVEPQVEPPRSETGTVLGRVVDAATGEGIPSVDLVLVVEETRLQTTTDENGSYRMEDVPAGLYTATASRPGYAEQSQTVTVPPAEEVRVDFALQPAQFEEKIVVTGTHIRGVSEIGSPPVTLITREDIDTSGHATVPDLLKTLPQNFGGAVSEVSNADFSAMNLNLGTAVDLRGLGADSTLVLVNGRRQPAGGLNGAFIDVSSIATSAIDRIEVLTDGASAIYGSDAVGGVVNFILRKDYEGAETRLRAGTLGGDATETQVSQILGRKWAHGSVLLGYQYNERNALAREDRAFAASDDLRPFGGSDFRSTESNPGNILCPFGRPDLGCAPFTPVFAIPPGQDGRDLKPSDLLADVVNHKESSERSDLLPEQELHGAFLTASQNLGERLELFVEGRYGRRNMTVRNPGASAVLDVPASNPFFVDPFGDSSSVTVAYNFLDDLGPLTGSSKTETFAGTLGAEAAIGRSWRTTLAASYGDETVRFANTNLVDFAALFEALQNPDPSQAFNPFGDGSNTNPATLDAIRGSQENRANTRLWTANVVADGPVFPLPGGLARLAVGGDYREEDLTTRLASSLLLQDFGFSTGRQISAAFAELALPIVGPDNARPAVRHLAISLAGRYEDYSDFGSTFDPKIGLRWAPIPPLALRGTWGTSFKAPRLGELPEDPSASAGNSIFQATVPDPRSPIGFSPVLFLLGNNASLQPEEATTRTAGLDLTPAAVPGLVASLTHHDIDFTDRIAIGGPAQNPLNVLLEEDVWADIITRNPTRSVVDRLCNDPRFVGSVPSCLESEPEAVVDIRWRNLAAVRTRGIDLSVEHSTDTAGGTFGYQVGGSYVLDFKQTVSTRAPTVDLVDTIGNVPALRLRGGLSWGHRSVGANVSVNYTDSYEDNLSVPSRRIGSWSTVDVGAHYRIARGQGTLSDLQFNLSVLNILDEDPPFANFGFIGQAFGYDPANADPQGRAVSAWITKSW